MNPTALRDLATKRREKLGDKETRLTKALDGAADEIERLRPYEEAHNKLTEQLQQLGEEFGCLGGQNRVAWLREQLERLRVCEQKGNSE